MFSLSKHLSLEALPRDRADLRVEVSVTQGMKMEAQLPWELTAQFNFLSSLLFLE